MLRPTKVPGANPKVCLLSGEYPPQIGGVGDYTYNLAHALAQAGLEIEVITRRPDQSKDLTFCCRGLGDKPLQQAEGQVNYLHLHRILPPGAFGFLACRVLFRHLHQNRPEILIFQYVPHLYGRAGIVPLVSLLPLLARLAGVPCICMFHEIYTRWDHKKRPPLKILVQWFFQFFQALLLVNFSQRIITSNPAYARQLNKLARFSSQKKNCEIIPVGSNVTLAKISCEERTRLRSSLDLTVSGPLLLVFSPFTVSKDLEICLKVLQQMPQAVLICLGGKPDPARLMAFQTQAQILGVKERLRILPGPLPTAEISGWLQTVDVYLHPTHGGASGRSGALAAALQHGLAVIAYNGMETSTAFKDGKNISLVTPGDTEAIVTLLERLQRDPALLCNLRSGATQLYNSTANWATIAKGFEKVMSDE